MASIVITSSIQRVSVCIPHHISNKQSFQSRPSPALGTKQAIKLLTPNLTEKQEKSPFSTIDNMKEVIRNDEVQHSHNVSTPRFCDERWRNGTWDLNMFVKKGRMDWDAVIVAEARRRKFFELHPEAATNEEPVLFRSSVIPLWAWIVHSHLPKAELLNGRAAMIGFFMAYFVDALTGLNVVGQAGNFICKAALLFAIFGIVIFQRSDDLENIRKLADDATFYDKQWQASWQNEDSSNNV